MSSIFHFTTMGKTASTSAYDLIPDDLLPTLPKMGETSEEQDPMVHIKLFDPTGSWTWFVIEYDLEDRICYGWVCGFEQEFGSFALAELEELGGSQLKLGIERDLYFEPCRVSQLPEPYRPTYL